MEKMFEKIKIRTRLVLLVSITVVAVMSVILFSYRGLTTLNHNMNKMYAQNFEAYQLLVRIRDGIRMTRISSGDLMVETDSAKVNEIVEQINNNSQAINERIDEFKQLEVSSEVEKAFNEFEVKVEEYRSVRDEAVKLAMNEKNEKASELLEDGQPLLNEIFSIINTLAVGERNEMSVFYEDSQEHFSEAITNLIVIGFIALTISIVMSLLIASSLTKPINIMRVKLSQIASGDLTVKIPRHYKHEFGEMFNSLREMLGGFKILLNNAKGAANGAVQKTDVVATDVESQLIALKESSVAIDSIAHGIQQIAESSTSVAELAVETSTQANDGSAVIEKSVTQMETINRVVEETSSVVGRLVTRAKTIDGALKVITGIAEQTNLLALNASIEAARAGEQGRGFAVVASEVSKLAAQSKESANEIDALLQEINKETNAAVRAMEKGKMETKQGIEVIRQAGEAFSSIVEQVTTMTAQVQDVSATVEEMSAGTEEVNVSLGDVVNTSERVSRHAWDVKEQNIALEKDLYKFKTGDTVYIESEDEIEE